MKNKEKEFVNLIEENQGLIHKVCRTYTDTPDEHDDLFQEIVLQIWKSYNSFKGDSKISTWMYRIGLNTAITLIRKRKKRIVETELGETLNNIKSEEKNEVYEEQLQLLYAAIKQLNDVDKALILLYLEDLSYKEISKIMGITEVNARVKISRIKTRLKEIMS